MKRGKKGREQVSGPSKLNYLKDGAHQILVVLLADQMVRLALN
jgi:hypothetical protein